MEPEHISVYGLNIEPNTVWGDLFLMESWNCLVKMNVEKCIEWPGRCCRRQVLQYEISNYARPGYECQHNLGYWYRRPYRNRSGSLPLSGEPGTKIILTWANTFKH